AANTFQGLHGQQGVALTDLGQVAAVKQLEELDGELNIADAAVASLDLGVADAGSAGLLLDLSLEGLDVIDLREAQVFAGDEPLEGAQEGLAELAVPGYGPDLDQRLSLPGAAHGVVVG